MRSFLDCLDYNSRILFACKWNRAQIPVVNLQVDLQPHAGDPRLVFYNSMLRLAGSRAGSEKPKCYQNLQKTKIFLLF